MKHIILFGNYHSRLFLGLAVILTVFFTSVLNAQITSIKLPTADSTSGFRVLNNSCTTLFRLNGDAGFYLGGTYGTGTVPKTGAGTRLMWYPRRSAFRAGYVSGTQWDDENTGSMSAAFGYNTTASGSYSTASGYYSISSGNNSTALGNSTTASGMNAVALGTLTSAGGDYSTAMGYRTIAAGEYSTAIGYWTVASGKASISLGDSTVASGYGSTAMGFRTTATGTYSTAMGRETTANGELSTVMGKSTVANGYASTALGANTQALGNYSTAMGYTTTASGLFSTAIGFFVSTDNKAGACIIGDASASIITKSSADYEMTMRFAGGYRLFSSSDLTAGVTLAGDGNSWSSVSDARRKEQFVKADGEYFLNGLAQLKLGSWNYIGQDAKDFRHYGPMAQEIFKYFGNDGIGTIGNDTTLASADMDGIMMICLQALEKRTSELQRANEKIEQLKVQLLQQKASQEKMNVKLTEQIEKLSQILLSSEPINHSRFVENTPKEAQQ